MNGCLTFTESSLIIRLVNFFLAANAHKFFAMRT
jgi:hypothetical protein